MHLFNSISIIVHILLNIIKLQFFSISDKDVILLINIYEIIILQILLFDFILTLFLGMRIPDAL